MAKPHALRLSHGEKLACGQPSQPGQATCQAIIATAQDAVPAVAGVPAVGYGPSDLRSAYALRRASLRDGGGKTVAIVDAFNNPDLAKNLASYRSHYRLPACTLSTHCLRVVNQTGGTRLPSVPSPTSMNFGWTVEESLDLDMVSAICPRCHILLVEAKNGAINNLGIAENTAVRLGARFVSNSWSGFEFLGQDSANHFFNHPGDAIVFAAGDFGYGTMYPTDLQYVTAVGGTRLVRSKTTRGWTETVWGSSTNADGGTGSGCSTLEPKATWQRVDDAAPNGCLNRTGNDVAADASFGTGVAVYDTYRTGHKLFKVGGTSVAAPIITAAYALAGNPAHGTYPAEYPYRHATSLYEVTAGLNGVCESFRRYLCHGQRGYNGPTGNGTPRGTGGFSASGVNPVTVLDPGTRDVLSGSSFNITIAATDSDRLATSLSYSATGLPPGLKIASVSHSLNGVITGTLPSVTTATGFKVTVTATDKRIARSNSTLFEIYVMPSVANSTASPGFGQVALNGGSECLSAASLTVGSMLMTAVCSAMPAAPDWEFVSGAAPGSTGELQLGPAGTLCAEVTNLDHPQLATCDGDRFEQWEYVPVVNNSGHLFSLLYNKAVNQCLSGHKRVGGPDLCGFVSGRGRAVLGAVRNVRGLGAGHGPVPVFRRDDPAVGGVLSRRCDAGLAPRRWQPAEPNPGHLPGDQQHPRPS